MRILLCKECKMREWKDFGVSDDTKLGTADAALRTLQLLVNHLSIKVEFTFKYQRRLIILKRFTASEGLTD